MKSGPQSLSERDLRTMPSSAYKYSRWDGTQNIFDVDASELMDRLSDDLLSHGDVWKALRELMRQGMGQQTPGLKALMERLKERREHQLQQYNLDSVMEDLKERLDNILEAEQQGIKTRLDEARREIDKAEGPERAQMEELNKLLEQRAQRNLEKLDNLPPKSRRDHQRADGIRFYGPRRPANVPRAAGYPQGPDGGEHLPGYD